ncbi:hypothetical protein PHLCEN_2v6341 [Hermanssonia centrifuga]|uniref:Uncharacterized protein n=1 Tax=Hermanssonia centrifuga TaxID=98765 RepID=A0A2R6NZP4_9APHY|nr:hypothetical protein PHLCEN_2v6341 [Hermanssonia centrifuga]
MPAVGDTIAFTFQLPEYIKNPPSVQHSATRTHLFPTLLRFPKLIMNCLKSLHSRILARPNQAALTLVFKALDPLTPTPEILII